MRKIMMFIPFLLSCAGTLPNGFTVPCLELESTLMTKVGSNQCTIAWHPTSLPIFPMTLEADLIPHLEKAVKHFNEQMGVTIYTMEPEEANGVVSVKTTASFPDKPERRGQTNYFGRSGMMMDVSIVLLESLFDDEKTLFSVLVHELGHAVGLAHIGTGCQVMTPNVDKDGECNEFSPVHVEAIQELYKSREACQHMREARAKK